MTKTNRTYNLSSGLQDELAAALKEHIDTHVAAWEEQVNDGKIGDEALAVFVAMGWVSSHKDPRLTVVVENEP